MVRVIGRFEKSKGSGNRNSIERNSKTNFIKAVSVAIPTGSTRANTTSKLLVLPRGKMNRQERDRVKSLNVMPSCRH